MQAEDSIAVAEEEADGLGGDGVRLYGCGSTVERDAPVPVREELVVADRVTMRRGDADPRERVVRHRRMIEHVARASAHLDAKERVVSDVVVGDRLVIAPRAVLVEPADQYSRLAAAGHRAVVQHVV